MRYPGSFVAAAVLFCQADENSSADTWYIAKGETGLYGYIDRQGQWMIEPQYVSGDTYFTGMYIRAGMDESLSGRHQGVIDRQGSWILSPDYDLFPMEYIGTEEENGEGLLAVTPEDFWLPRGFFDLDTGYFSGFQWDSVYPYYSESHLIAVISDDHKAGYADRHTGELVLPALYGSLDPVLFYQGVAMVVLQDDNLFSSYNYFLMDESGKIIPFPEGICGIPGSRASCGRIIVAEEQDSGQGIECLGYIDLSGQLVIRPQFQNAEDFSEDRAVVLFAEGDYGVIDLNGNIILRGLSKIFDRYYENGIITAQRDDEYVCFDIDGNELSGLTPFSMAVEDQLYNTFPNPCTIGSA